MCKFGGRWVMGGMEGGRIDGRLPMTALMDVLMGLHLWHCLDQGCVSRC